MFFLTYHYSGCFRFCWTSKETSQLIGDKRQGLRKGFRNQLIEIRFEVKKRAKEHLTKGLSAFKRVEIGNHERDKA